jgi:hypothetical protein
VDSYFTDVQIEHALIPKGFVFAVTLDHALAVVKELLIIGLRNHAIYFQIAHINT